MHHSCCIDQHFNVVCAVVSNVLDACNDRRSVGDVAGMRGVGKRGGGRGGKRVKDGLQEWKIATDASHGIAEVGENSRTLQTNTASGTRYNCSGEHCSNAIVV